MLREKLREEALQELETDILPFWLKYKDYERGGFYGSIALDGSVDAKADKGLVMHARLLYAYSRAYRVFPRREYLDAAETAYEFLRGPLYDTEHGGYHWSCDYQGYPRAGRKVIYGQAFALYALSEFYRATGRAEALDRASELYGLIESRGKDAARGGYWEACAADWSAPLASALGENDETCPKSMNTNLHVLEALSAFVKASGRRDAAESLSALIGAHLERMMTGMGSFGLYFDAEWTCTDPTRDSFGHDIEASWLLCEAALVARGTIDARLRRAVLGICEAALELVGPRGWLPNEVSGGAIDETSVWWVQAEALVGFANAWALSGEERWIEAVGAIWSHIKERLLDRSGGEWLWMWSPDGRAKGEAPKGGFWKAAYHNGRACMELIERLADHARKGA